MTNSLVQDTRIQPLNDRPLQDGAYVLYWMQQAQRAEYNHALEYAIQRANQLSQPVLVIFGLTDRYPDANLRHYTFMLEGLQETQRVLADRDIKMVVRHGDPVEVALSLTGYASLAVCDRAVYLPMYGRGASLNVHVSLGVAAYHILQSRPPPGTAPSSGL